jgi:hypothetical protein
MPVRSFLEQVTNMGDKGGRAGVGHHGDGYSMSRSSPEALTLCEMVQEGRILQTDSPAEVKKKYPELFGQYTQRSFYSVLKWAFQYVQNIDNNLGSIVGSMLNQKPAAARKLLRVGCRCLALLSAPSSSYTILARF